MAYKVLALLHGQLLPLPKGINVSVVKNICASNKTSRKPSCDAGPCGKAGLPISVLLALSSLFLKMRHSYLSSLPRTKRSPATFSLVFHSIVPVLSFTYFQVCCIYCYITWCCCTVKCNRAHTYGIWSLLPEAVYIDKNMALNWTADVIHKIYISVNWSQSGQRFGLHWLRELKECTVQLQQPLGAVLCERSSEISTFFHFYFFL